MRRINLPSSASEEVNQTEPQSRHAGKARTLPNLRVLLKPGLTRTLSASPSGILLIYPSLLLPRRAQQTRLLDVRCTATLRLKKAGWVRCLSRLTRGQLVTDGKRFWLGSAGRGRKRRWPGSRTAGEEDGAKISSGTKRRDVHRRAFSLPCTTNRCVGRDAPQPFRN
jgi:hypothetical protein